MKNYTNNCNNLHKEKNNPNKQQNELFHSEPWPEDLKLIKQMESVNATNW